MNQCVPSWDLDKNPNSYKLAVCTRSDSSNSLAPNVPSLDYEVAELTWENGQLAMHGLAPSRVVNKPAATAAVVATSPTKYTTWDKPRAGGTLESIVNQATSHPHPKFAVNGGGNNVNDLVPWLDHYPNANSAARATMTNMDALVPCDNNIRRNDIQENSTHVLESVPGIGTCMVGSCSGTATAAASAAATDGGVRGGGGRFARAGPCCCGTNASVSESATCGGRDSRQVTLDSCEREFGGGGLTSTSLWSPENTNSGEEYTKTSANDHDSVCRSRSQVSDKGKSKGIGKSSISAKRRAAAIHNQSERRRRDKINQRMKTLQKLVPNSSKTDKASMLDEVIEYLKQLQAQVQMMSRMNMPAMMLPLPMQQQLQMSMMAPAMGMGMGVMDINNIGRPAAMLPVIPTTAAAAAAAFMPMASWDIQAGDRLQAQPVMPDFLSTFLACQSQPMAVDAYSRLAALYQQFQQHAGSGSKN